MRDRHVIILGQVCRYEDKAPFVASRKSVLGALEYRIDDDALKCHECGEWSGRLNSHVRSHGISGPQYRARHGLKLGTKLEGPRAIATKPKRVMSPEEKKRLHNIRTKRSGPSIAFSEYSPTRRGLEARNLRGLCRAQLESRIKKIACDLGHAPSWTDLEVIDPGLVRAVRSEFGSMGEMCGVLGLEVRHPGRRRTSINHGGRNGCRNPYTQSILIELLRDFYVLNRRLPKSIEMFTGLLPSRPTFIKYFGTMQAAYYAAGLSTADGKSVAA